MMKSHAGRSVFLSEERIEKMSTSGAWLNKTLAEVFDAQVEKMPDKTAVVSYSEESSKRRRSLTYRELQDLTIEVAFDLLSKGIGLGDIVSMQLPNRHEALAVCIACARIGAIINPLMPVLRQRELRHILTLTETSVLYIPDEFRGFSFSQMAEELVSTIPSLTYIETVDDDGFAISAQPAQVSAPDWQALLPGPNELFQVMFTSGTTGEPKGTMHTANTLLANVAELQRRFKVDSHDVIHCPTPVTHQLGFLFGILLNSFCGATVIFQESWDKDQALNILAREHVTICLGATPYLTDVASHPRLHDHDIGAFRLFVSGGAPIPSSLVEIGVRNLVAKVISIWGMTEVLAVTTVRLDDPDERVSGTDGVATRHTEVRIVDAAGNQMPSGTEGRLETRGATVCVGYLKRPELYTPRDGWFDTGDLARMDDAGYIRITGRSKDIIIRGGENIPVVEIEGLLFMHPDIQQVAIVAMPDERLGERACAFATVTGGARPSLSEIQQYLLDQQVSKAFLPERFEIIPDMPMTATGKVLKFELRERAQILTAVTS